MKEDLGGDRIGSGNKMEVQMHDYGRSNFNLNTKRKTTMSAGTVVPIHTMVGLKGDSFKMKISADALTSPAVGPMFGAFKLQVDTFKTPMRLFIPEMMLNTVDKGLAMDTVKIPLIRITANTPNGYENVNNQQVNASAALKYLGIAGLGGNASSGESEVIRNFNALPYLMYAEIYKQYYANKQEQDGVVIHNDLRGLDVVSSSAEWFWGNGSSTGLLNQEIPPAVPLTMNPVGSSIEIAFSTYEEFDVERLMIWIDPAGAPTGFYKATDLFYNWTWDGTALSLTGTDLRYSGWVGEFKVGAYYIDTRVRSDNDTKPKLVRFKLSNIDDERRRIMRNSVDGSNYIIEEGWTAPYGLQLFSNASGGYRYRSLTSSQEGLFIKTYLSDINNNWIRTTAIDGENGITNLTRIYVDEENAITVNEIELMYKLNNMLMRIQVTGGAINDYMDAVYEADKYSLPNTPEYCGGMSSEIRFEQIISNASSTTNNGEQPLGTLAGRGYMSDRKGGYVTIKCNEHSYIQTMVSITPRIEYSQGNTFDMDIKNMNQWHKPALDQIGFQNRSTDYMAWFDTNINEMGTIGYQSVGKIPAWMDYMTDVDKNFGNFAVKESQMFMVLDRNYKCKFVDGGYTRAEDLTTYIDPSKYNYVFAQTDLTSQNFWVQVDFKITKRSIMSDKLMPNL